MLAGLGFVHALWAMAAGLVIILVAAVTLLPGDMGKAKTKVKFTKILSKSRAINLLSAARFFLFGARDVWFVVGVPIFLYEVIGWSFMEVGSFMAAWVIGYGGVQALAPSFVNDPSMGNPARLRAAQWWAFRSGRLAGRNRRAGRSRRCAGGERGRRAGAVRHRLCDQFVGPLLSYSVFLRFRQGRAQCPVLLHGECRWTPCRLPLFSGLSYQMWGLAGCLLTASTMVLAAGAITIVLAGEQCAPARSEA